MTNELSFDLAGAVWPVLLVDGAGVIVSANPAARNTLGPSVEGASAKLATFWAADNRLALEKFLESDEGAFGPLTPLKLELPGGPKSFSGLINSRREAGRRLLLLQLLPVPAQPDSGAAHKQKLDCALQLARSVALDFNNALTSILGYTSLLLSKAEAAHPWRRTLIEMEKSASKAAEVAADLAAFSLQEKESRAQAAGNLNGVVQRCVAFFQNSSRASIQWSLNLERRLFAVKFDEAKLQQALMKVLENAAESLETGGQINVRSGNLELTDACQDRNARLAAGAYVCLEIGDNGGGIPAEILPRVFEPFFTTKSAPHRGLGLAWVYGIVTNHGGGVAVSSQPGAGTSVRIYLPAERHYVHGDLDASADLSGTQTILLVDDEELLLRMGETILSTYGYHVLTANSGAKALEFFAPGAAPVDLLLTDLVMPLMSGRELVEQVRRLAPGTRILCTSGYVWPGNQREKVLFLQKPFTTQELLVKVKTALAETPNGQLTRTGK